MNRKKLVSGLVFIGGSVYYGINLYERFVQYNYGLTYAVTMSVIVLVGFLLGVLSLLDAFNLSLLKKEKSETDKILDGDLEQEFLYPDTPDADFSNIFRTKLGLCYVMKDRIILVSDAADINPENKVVEKDGRPILILFGAIGLVLIGLSINSLLLRFSFSNLIFGATGVYLIVKMILSFKNSATPIIPRSRIKEFKYKKSLPFVTSGYFSIVFLDQYGQTKKSLIVLPGIFDEGSAEGEKAVKILRAERFMS
jgi:hypothetical protein